VSLRICDFQLDLVICSEHHRFHAPQLDLVIFDMFRLDLVILNEHDH
jgi:hypothetical protein